VSAHLLAVLLAWLLAGFIAGVAVASVAGWFLRDRIKARMGRRHRKRFP
jgi:hypothetical protein